MGEGGTEALLSVVTGMCGWIGTPRPRSAISYQAPSAHSTQQMALTATAATTRTRKNLDAATIG